MVVLVTDVGAVIIPVVHGAEHQNDNRRFDLRPQFLQQQVLLIRAVAGNPGRENLVAACDA